MLLKPLLERNLLSYSQVIHIQPGNLGNKAISRLIRRRFHKSFAWQFQNSSIKSPTILVEEINFE